MDQAERINSIMDSLERPANLQVPDGWMNGLQKKLDGARGKKNQRVYVNRYTGLVIALFVVFNAFCVLKVLGRKSAADRPPVNDYRVLTRDLLVNPSSANY